MTMVGPSKEWQAMADAVGDVDVRISEEQKAKVRYLIAGQPGVDAPLAEEFMLMLGVHPSQKDDDSPTLPPGGSVTKDKARSTPPRMLSRVWS